MSEKRKRNKGGIYESPSGVWWFSITVNGVRRRISTKTKNKLDAIKIAETARVKARESGMSPAIVRQLRGRVETVAEYAVKFADWIEKADTLRPKTRAFYRYGLSHLLNSPIARIPMNCINQEACDTAGFRTVSIKRCSLSVLRVLLHKAAAAEHIAITPKIGLPPQSERKAAMSWDQCQKIAGKMGKGDAQDALYVLRSTGMRPAECFAMRWEHLDFERGAYSVQQSKSDKGVRTVPLLDRAPDVLNRRHVEQGFPKSGWVFPSRSKCGHLLSIKTAYNRARKAAGLPQEICLYTGRHGALTDFHQSMPPVLALQIAGHADMASAKRYQHHNEAIAQQLLDRHRSAGLADSPAKPESVN